MRQLHDDHRQPLSPAALGFFVGLLAGALAGIFLHKRTAGLRRAGAFGSVREELRDNIAERFANAKDLTRRTYEEIVDEVVEEARLVGAITKETARRIASILRSRYADMRAEAKRARRDKEGVGQEIEDERGIK